MSVRARNLLLLLAWLALTLAGCIAGVHMSLERERFVFENEANSLHRWLSQQARHHEALVETLALLQPRPEPGERLMPETRLPSVHPAVQKVLRHDAQNPWPGAMAERLAVAEAQSRSSQRPVLALLELAAGRQWLVRAGDPASFALQLDLRQLASQGESSPMATHGQVRAWLEYAGQRRVLAPGAAGADDPGGWRYGFRQRLSVESLPAELVAVRRVGWLSLPWAELAAWCLATSLLAIGLAAWFQRQARLRHEADTEFLHSDSLEAVWLSTLSPAPGSAERSGTALARHNPMVVTLREIDKEPPELAVARGAIRQAAQQARRASEVISRLSAHTEPGSLGQGSQGVRPDELLRDALELLEPECERLGVVTTLATDEDIGWVMADPMALEQVVHQLLRHALQAVARVPPGERRIELTLAAQTQELVLSLRDSGPMPPTAPAGTLPTLPQSLMACHNWALQAHGSLSVVPAPPRGSLVRLVIPRHA
ncbi:MAG: hypothetical protein JNJ71_12925 [Rubrivivax sp.]|nr:hypothetical protein [Rubrivivax sp.]